MYSFIVLRYETSFLSFSDQFFKAFSCYFIMKMSSEDKVNNIKYPCLQHPSWIGIGLWRFVYPVLPRISSGFIIIIICFHLCRNRVSLYIPDCGQNHSNPPALAPQCWNYRCDTWLLEYFKQVFSEPTVCICYGLKGSPSLTYIKQI